MAKISLRAYNREIEQLISRGQTDEAVAHCRYILKLFPKHIDTYRLLGKAYLESQHYTDAADILQRILSVVPDDFVSQLGMSMVREDEGNLDAAIWHMERAFEIQPMNKAVQDELRRLYGRRDGVEPPRVRNTRGALVRMYARGELYPQAIAEARAALTEDPRRIDLEIILARSYYLSGQLVEATEICSRLINRLPFCYEANRILADILPKTSRGEDAKVYQQNVKALDPYTAFLSPNTPTVDQIPENAVTLERLEWQASLEPTSQQPDWAASVGVKVQEQDQTLPDWLVIPPSSLTPASAQESAPTVKPPQVQPAKPPIQPSASEAAIPDWLKTAGWGESTGENQEITAIEDGSADEPLPAEIPDWLKSMAPSGPETIGAISAEESGKLDFLNSLLPEASLTEEPVHEDSSVQTSVSTPVNVEPTAASVPPTSDFPEQIPLAQTKPEAEPQLPDWLLEEINATRTSPPPQVVTPEAAKTVEPTSGVSTDLNLPDSLSRDTRPNNAIGSVEEIPDWPASTGEMPAITPATYGPNVDQSSSMPEKNPEADEIPDWLKDIQLPQDTSASSSTSEIGVLPGGLSQAETPQADIPAQPLEASSDLLTTYLTAAPLKEPGTLSPETLPQEVIPAAVENELPDWLKMNPAAQETPQAEETPRDELPDWLKEINGAPVSQGISSQPPADEKPQGLPDWLLESEKPQVSQAADLGEIPPTTAEIAPVASGAATNPVESIEGLPDWLLDLEHPQASPTQATAESPLPPVAASAEGSSLISESAKTTESLPDWLLDLEHPQAAQTPVAEEITSIPEPVSAEESSTIIEPAKTTESQPDWLLDLEQPQAAQTPVAEEIPSIPEPVSAEESSSISKPEDTPESLPDWLLQIDQAQTPQASEPPIVPTASNVVEPIVDTNTTDAISEAAVQPEGVDEDLAWLESLAARQGASEETLLTRLEDRQETMPEWIKDSLASEEPQAVQAQPESQLPQSESQSEIPPVLEVHPIVDQSAASSVHETPPSAPVSKQPIEDLDPALAWLESLALGQGASEETLLSKPEERSSIPPDWVTAEVQAAAPETSTPEPAQYQDEISHTGITLQETQEEIIHPDEQPLPTVGIEQIEASKSGSKPVQEPSLGIDADLAWLESLAARQGAGEETLPTQPEDRQAELPDGFKQEMEAAIAQPESANAELTASAPEQVQGELPAVEGFAESALPAAEEQLAVSAASVDDETFAWLEGLAARQGASEDSLINKPEERGEEMPSWILESEEKAATPEPTPAAFESPLDQTQVSDAEQALTSPFTSETLKFEQPTKTVVPPIEEPLPDWLKDITSESHPIQSTIEETPIWTQDEQTKADFEQYTPDRVTPPESEPAATELSIEDTQPIWIQQSTDTPHSPSVMAQPVDEQISSGSVDLYQIAQAALDSGDVENALQDYHKLIQDGEMLDQTINDLQTALYRYPMDISLMEALGDAYMKNNQIQEALDTYTKAEELLR